MREDLADAPLPAEAATQLRFLRALTAGLAVVMGAGMVAIVVLLWLRLPAAVAAPGAAGPGALPPLPPGLVLPAGAVPAAVTFARDWTVVVTQAGEVLLYDRAGALQRRVAP